MGKPWKELEAQGVKRCCAMFVSGKRCRRRAEDQPRGGFCKVHGPMIDALVAPHINALKASGEMK